MIGTLPAVDLIIADVPEGLHVPTVFAPPGPIPKWNQFDPQSQWLSPIFDFAPEYLVDSGGLLLMYPTPSVRHKSQILGCCKEFNFKLLMTWLRMNCLHLTSPSNQSRTVKSSLQIFVVTCISYLHMIWTHISVHYADHALCYLPSCEGFRTKNSK